VSFLSDYDYYHQPHILLLRMRAVLRACDDARREFPIAFNPEAPLPLTYRADHVVRDKLKLTKMQAKDFMRAWRNRSAYLRALATSRRFHWLDGSPGSNISTETRNAARDELRRRKHCDMDAT
jgi:hypothetical protein